jgi:hypothetical protein
MGVTTDDLLAAVDKAVSAARTGTLIGTGDKA